MSCRAASVRLTGLQSLTQYTTAHNAHLKVLSVLERISVLPNKKNSMGPDDLKVDVIQIKIAAVEGEPGCIHMGKLHF